MKKYKVKPKTDPKEPMSISVRRSIQKKLRDKAEAEDRSISNVVDRIFAEALK